MIRVTLVSMLLGITAAQYSAQRPTAKSPETMEMVPAWYTLPKAPQAAPPSFYERREPTYDRIERPPIQHTNSYAGYPSYTNRQPFDSLSSLAASGGSLSSLPNRRYPSTNVGPDVSGRHHRVALHHHHHHQNHQNQRHLLPSHFPPETSSSAPTPTRRLLRLRGTKRYSPAVWYTSKATSPYNVIVTTSAPTSSAIPRWIPIDPTKDQLARWYDSVKTFYYMNKLLGWDNVKSLFFNSFLFHLHFPDPLFLPIFCGFGFFFSPSFAFLSYHGLLAIAVRVVLVALPQASPPQGQDHDDQKGPDYHHHPFHHNHLRAEHDHDSSDAKVPQTNLLDDHDQVDGTPPDPRAGGPASDEENVEESDAEEAVDHFYYHSYHHFFFFYFHFYLYLHLDHNDEPIEAHRKANLEAVDLRQGDVDADAAPDDVGSRPSLIGIPSGGQWNGLPNTELLAAIKDVVAKFKASLDEAGIDQDVRLMSNQLRNTWQQLRTGPMNEQLGRLFEKAAADAADQKRQP
ncbi:unnamed protein product [Caenorhabditis auriculariae]|uniref:SXP/RAL-2 family protein Ani s 5-like cation-binding domain-containing protein n=1 Tax=Caenorhabditis auriculariae TaxID=2777116 RepID=A0A8S1H8L7_9PELO|nr:unnamed protein product [Caenorhabditis auriculariae]